MFAFSFVSFALVPLAAFLLALLVTFTFFLLAAFKPGFTSLVIFVTDPLVTFTLPPIAVLVPVLLCMPRVVLMT